MNNVYSKIYLLLFLISIGASQVKAQMFNDGVFMPQNQLCAGFSVAQDQFSNYWEGTLKRDNPNIGTLTVQNVAFMFNYGITSRLNLMGTLPYVSTSATGGTLHPMKGLQDLTLGVKYQVFEHHFANKDQFSGVAEIGGSLPVTNYVSAFPLAIGTQCKTAFGRALLRYITDGDFLVEGMATYWLRSNVKIDQTSYYTNQFISSNEVVMPDVTQLKLKLGYYTYRWGAVLAGETLNCTSGADIRRGDMPFLNNNIDATRVGIEAHWRIEQLNDLYLTAEVFKTIDGRNVGEMTSMMFGVAYVLNFNKKEITPASK